MADVYDEYCIALASVKCWSKRFEEGCESCKVYPRPGQIHSAFIPNTIAQVDELVWQERKISIHEMAECVKISHVSVYTKIHDYSGYRFLCAHWMPKVLNDSQKTERVDAALNHLFRYQNEGGSFLSAAVTRHES